MKNSITVVRQTTAQLYDRKQKTWKYVEEAAGTGWSVWCSFHKMAWRGNNWAMGASQHWTCKLFISSAINNENILTTKIEPGLEASAMQKD